MRQIEASFKFLIRGLDKTMCPASTDMATDFPRQSPKDSTAQFVCVTAYSYENSWSMDDFIEVYFAVFTDLHNPK